MSYNDFFLPDLRYQATATEDLDNALRESGIPTMDLANALATRPRGRRLAPAPAGGVEKPRQWAPGGRKPRRQRIDADGKPVKKTGNACLSCRRSKVKCGGERPSCDRCSGKRQSCHYDRTTKEDVAQRAAAENARRHTEVIEQVAFAPRFRNIRSRPENPATALGELAAVPMLPPPLPEQIKQSQLNPVQSNADLSGPNQFTPTLYTPTLHTPTLHTPTQYTAAQYTPTQYTPTLFAPTRFGQNQFDPRSNESSQYPQDAATPSEGLESLPEHFQHPHESQFAQRDFSQLARGPLQYRGAFDSTHGAPIVQPDGIQPYVNYPSIVYPDVPAWSAWSNSVLPAQSVPRWPNDFGLESTNNAQTPAESSHHVKRAETLAYITAMMPLPENRRA